MNNLRPAVIADLTQIAAMADEALPEAWSPAALESSLALEHHHLMVVERATGDIAGYYLTSQVDCDIELLQLVVRKEYRRQQVGSQLLRQMIESSSPDDHITLEARVSNQAAITLYQHHGFTTIATRKNYYRPTLPNIQREDAVVMFKPSEASSRSDPTGFSHQTKGLED
ncbi:MAG: ribosomal protein S18-alanine N-acetyltransferase [Mariprofundales bacterium]